MNQNKDIDIRIRKAQAELRCLEKQQREILEKIRLLRLQKSQSAENLNFLESAKPKVTNLSSQKEKISLFRSLFKGREDVFPIRWENLKKEINGYQPGCKNEWVTGICEKPKIRCMDCNHREFIPLSDDIIANHLRGLDASKPVKQDFTIGVYPLLSDETCWFLAVDFDKKSWTDDVQAYLVTCDQYNVPAVLERSRSGNGAHVWIFFIEPVPAVSARQLGTFLLTQTMDKRPELGLNSYDRLFPSQDYMPKGAFGNLIALPLQRKPRNEGNSIFLNRNLMPFEDQWAFLSSIRRISQKDIEKILARIPDQSDVTGVRSVSAIEDQIKPWLEPPSRKRKEPALAGPFPDRVEIVLGNQIYLAKNALTPQLINRIIRSAAFQNPEFYKAQAMRFSTYNNPRIINCCDVFPDYIGLPRGCIQHSCRIATETT